MSARLSARRPRDYMRRRGFTLVSMVVAIFLLVVALLPLARTIEMSTMWNTVGTNRANALELARSYMEDLRGRDASTVVSESPVSVDATGRPAAAGQFTRSVEVATASRFLLRVRVIITAPRLAAPVELVTLLFVPEE